MQHLKQGVIQVLRQLDAKLREPPLLAAPTTELLLDPTLTLFPSDLAVIGAPAQPLAEQVSLRIASELAIGTSPRRDVLLVVDDVRRTMVQLLAREARVPPRVVANQDLASRQERVNLTYAAATLTNAPIFIEDASVALSWRVIATWLAERRSGVAFLPAAWPVADRSYEAAARFVRDAKAVARDTNATIVLPWRLKSGTSRPLVTDLLGCGAVEDDADLVLLVDGTDWRVTRVSLGKNRHGPLDILRFAPHAAPPSPPSPPPRATRLPRARQRAQDSKHDTSDAQSASPPATPSEHDHQTSATSNDGAGVAQATDADADATLLSEVVAVLAQGPLKARQLRQRLSHQGRVVTKKALNRLLYRSLGSVVGLAVNDGVWRIDPA